MEVLPVYNQCHSCGETAAIDGPSKRWDWQKFLDCRSGNSLNFVSAVGALIQLLSVLPVSRLTTVFLWCIVHGKVTRACAPTGIAAANVEIQGTPVSATTLHALFDLDTDLKTVEWD